MWKCYHSIYSQHFSFQTGSVCEQFTYRGRPFSELQYLRKNFILRLTINSVLFIVNSNDFSWVLFTGLGLIHLQQTLTQFSRSRYFFLLDDQQTPLVAAWDTWIFAPLALLTFAAFCQMMSILAQFDLKFTGDIPETLPIRSQPPYCLILHICYNRKHEENGVHCGLKSLR